MEKKLTKLQAYNATVKLFRIYYRLTDSDDLGGILGGMSFLQNNKTADSAMWEIWGECLEKIFPHKKIQNFKFLTRLEAFIAMGYFLEEYYGKVDVENITIFLENNAQLALDKKCIDKVLWQNWLSCVHEVLLANNSKYYLKILPKQ
jgi:hypothetical protein